METLLTTRSWSYNFEVIALIIEDPEFIEHYTNKGGTAEILEGFAYIAYYTNIPHFAHFPIFTSAFYRARYFLPR